MVYFHEHVSMNSQKKKITCNLFSYPLVRSFSPVQRVQTRNQPVTRSTHTDQPINLFFQLFRQPISRLALFVSHEGACNGNGGLLQAHILSLSHQLHSVWMIVHSSSGTPPRSWCCPPASLLSHRETLSPFLSVSTCVTLLPPWCATLLTHTTSPWFLCNGGQDEECLLSARFQSEQNK